MNISVAEVAQLLIAVATLVSALAAWRNAARAAATVESTHALVNGQSEALRQLGASQAHSEGVAEGIKLERDRPPS